MNRKISALIATIVVFLTVSTCSVPITVHASEQTCTTYATNENIENTNPLEETNGPSSSEIANNEEEEQLKESLKQMKVNFWYLAFSCLKISVLTILSLIGLLIGIPIGLLLTIILLCKLP